MIHRLLPICLLLFVLVGCSRKNPNPPSLEVHELIPKYRASEHFSFVLFSEGNLQDFRFWPSLDTKNAILRIVENASKLERDKRAIETKLSSKSTTIPGPGPYILPPAGVLSIVHDELPELKIAIMHTGTQVHLRCGNRMASLDTQDESKDLLGFLKLVEMERRKERREALTDHVRRYFGIFLVGSLTSQNEWQSLINFLTLLCDELQALEEMTRNGEKAR